MVLSTFDEVEVLLMRKLVDIKRARIILAHAMLVHEKEFMNKQSPIVALVSSLKRRIDVEVRGFS